MTDELRRLLTDAASALSLADYVARAAPWELLRWERQFLERAFTQPDDAALSLSRGNGKSALLAAVATAVVDPTGPLHADAAEVVVVASSFEQSRVIFEDVKRILSGRYEALGGITGTRARRWWRVQDSANRALIEVRATGARVRCIGSDPTRAHGLRPALVLADEPAQWPTATSDRMLAALRTSMGKVAGSRLVALGTRPATGSHWFAAMLAGGAGYAQLHAARPHDPPFQRRTWRRANPSLDAMPELERRIRLEASAARKDPTLLPSFRALRLNLGTSDVTEAVLLESHTWRRIEAPRDDAPAGDGPRIYGVDLGSGAAMSAIACYWPDTGRLDALAAFPAEPPLSDRGLTDGVGSRYSEMARRGELLVAGRRVVDVATLLAAAVDRFGPPDVVVADAWRRGELVEALTDAEITTGARLVTRGMGYQHGGEDVRLFRRSALDGTLTPVESLLMRSAMSDARTTADTAGNEKLAKRSEGGRRARARDDAAAAAILAVAEGHRHRARADAPAWRWGGIA
jgi:phage terminase large subunit-like protein